jgi:hypothetical protein
LIASTSSKRYPSEKNVPRMRVPGADGFGIDDSCSVCGRPTCGMKRYCTSGSIVCRMRVSPRYGKL